MAKNPAYIGLFLTPSSREALLSYFPAIHPNVHADHLTLVFMPDEQDMKDFLPVLGSIFTIHVIGRHADEKGQAVEVARGSIPQCKNEFPHITISCANGVKPVYSNELLKTAPWRKEHIVTTKLRVHAVLDVFPRSVRE